MNLNEILFFLLGSVIAVVMQVWYMRKYWTKITGGDVLGTIACGMMSWLYVMLFGLIALSWFVIGAASKVVIWEKPKEDGADNE